MNDRQTTAYGWGQDSQPATLIELLRRRAQCQSSQLSQVFLADGEAEEEELTYGELDRRARAIASGLQTEGEVGERVLLLYPPGLEFIRAFFGCLYAGRVAVPAYPPRLNRNLLRLQSILTDAQATTVLAPSALLSRVKPMFDMVPDLRRLRWVCTDEVSEGGREWQEPPAARDSLAFIQYTSGSTGSPKGVMLTHGNLLHNASLVFGALGHTAQDKYVSWLPTFHDMGFMAGILQPLYAGIPSILLSPASFLQSPARWLRAISRYRATTSGGPNFAYDLCVRKITPAQMEGVDLSSWSGAFNGAEPVRNSTLEQFTEAFGRYGFRREAFYPCYGLAEATLMASGGVKSEPPVVREVSARALERNLARGAAADGEETKALVGCGRSMRGQRIAIVNPETLSRCPPEEVGEIWVAGESVARGYWNREAETAETFRAYMAGTGEGPFLRTGDLGFCHDGELFVTGRLKDLIIIRGLNHYPQDIEQTAERSHPALRPGCGAAFSVESGGEERLVVVQEIEHQSGADLRQVCALIRQAVSEEHEIQVHAIALIKQGSIPKTSSGKIQRRATKAGFLERSLSELFRDTVEESSIARSEDGITRADLLAAGAGRRALIETYLREQVARGLRTAPGQLDVDAPLTSLGLDSLLATELRNRFQSDLDLDVSFETLLQGCSISRLAAELAERLEEASADGASAPGRDIAAAPLSYTQQALWVLYRLAPDSPAYNVSFAASIASEVDVRALRLAFEELTRRHPVLRATFGEEDGRPAQFIREQQPIAFTQTDARGWDDVELDSALAGEAHRPFDLERGPVMRVNLFTRSAQEHALLLTVHHIAIDGWSFWVLLDELSTLYAAAKGEGGGPLPPLQRRYADYVRWQQELLQGAEGERLWSYWQKELAGELPMLNLPHSRPRPPVQTYHGASHAFTLSDALVRRLRALAGREGATPYMLLLAAFQVLLHRYSGQEDILVGAPVSGRSRKEFESLVGCFFNAVVLRARLSGDLRFTDFLRQVRRTVLRALEHQDYPSHLLAERLRLTRDPSRPPLFQVTFILQKPHRLPEGSTFLDGAAGAPPRGGRLPLKFLPFEKRSVRSDLEAELLEADGAISVWLHYNTDLFDAAAIARMAGHYQSLLEGILAHPEQRIAGLPLLTEGERHQLLVGWSASGKHYPSGGYVDELFEAQARRTPRNVAAVHDRLALTYQELSEQSSNLASLLLELKRDDSEQTASH